MNFALRMTEMKMCVGAITDILKEMFLYLPFIFLIVSVICAGVIKAVHKHQHGLQARCVVMIQVKY